MTGRAAREAGASAASPRLAPWLLAVGVVLVAINLRPAVSSVGPVLGRIEAQAGLSSGWAGALTALPVLCFGLLAPVAPVLARRLGIHAAVTVSMWTLLAGLLVRLIPGSALLFLGTALAGAAIAIGNVLLPVLVRRDFARRAGTAMSVFTGGLIGCSALAAGITVPAANALGGGWRPGLALWAIPAAVAAVAWLPALVRRRGRTQPGDVPTPSHEAIALLRRPLAWQLTLFFAVQTGGFYATLAWLPSIFRSHGASEAHAGVLLSVSMVVGLSAALTVPWLATRVRDQRPLVAGCCVLWALGWVGILVAPMSAPYLWAALLGLGQNGTFPLALVLMVLRGGSVAATQGLSTLAQSVGYALGAFAPLAVGAIHAAARSWTPAVVLLLVLLVPQFLFGLAAGRDRTLTSEEAAGTQSGGDPHPPVASVTSRA